MDTLVWSMCSFATNPLRLSCTIALSSVAIDTAPEPSNEKSAIPVPSVSAFVVVPIVVDVNAFEPSSLVPTTPLPLIINEVASEFWADNPLSVSVPVVTLPVKVIEPVVIESVVNMCSMVAEPSFFSKNILPSYVFIANSPKARWAVVRTLPSVEESLYFIV